MELVAILFFVEEAPIEKPFLKKERPKKPRVFNAKEKNVLKTKTLEDLDLYVRTKTVFKTAKITTLTELLNYSEEDLRKFRYMNEKAMENLKEELQKIKLKLKK